MKTKKKFSSVLIKVIIVFLICNINIDLEVPMFTQNFGLNIKENGKFSYPWSIARVFIGCLEIVQSSLAFAECVGTICIKLLDYYFTNCLRIV